jgi:peptide/nickel transport system permease protein
MVQRADGSVFTATAVELDGEMLRVLRGGAWSEVPRSSLRGRRPDDWHRWRRYWLGTDHLGRDLLSRMLAAAPVSLGVGLAAALLSAALGGLWGGLAGLSGRRLDGVLMRIADAFMAFPRLYLVLLVLAVLPGSLAGAVLVLAVTGWMGPARLVRARILATREQDFVVAARAAGRGRTGILLRHLLPHAAAPLLVAAGLRVGETMLLEAGLSFLGLGVPPPQASWGNLIAAGRSDLIGAWWVSVLPGVALAGAVLSFNALAEQARRGLARQAAAPQG